MVITESLLRTVIRKSILFEQEQAQREERLKGQVEDKIDTGLDSIDVNLDDLLGKIENIDPEEESEGKVGDEIAILGTLGAAAGYAGLALAIPIGLKAIGLIAKVVGDSLAAFESVVTDGMNQDMNDLGDDWMDWWFTKAEELQKKYKSWMKSLATSLLSLATDEPTEKQIKTLEKILWAILYASVGIKGGVTAWKAWKNASYLYSGFKGVTSALKEKDAAVYLYEVVVSLVETA